MKLRRERLRRLFSFALAATISGAMVHAADAPSINRIWSWKVTDSTAGLSMEINDKGQATSCYFMYGTDASLAGATKVGESQNPATASGVQSHAELKGLKPKTKYYFKAFVSGAGGSATSNVGDFTTAGGGTPPKIDKTWHWNVTGNAAGLSMTIDNFRLNSTTYFLWGTDAGLAGAAKTQEQRTQATSGGIGSHASLTGLKPDTTYYYRAVATSSDGTTQGPIQSFKTATAAAAGPPSINRIWSWKVTDSTAGLSMEINDKGQATSCYFMYGTDAGLAGATKVGESQNPATASGVQSHAELKGLKPATKYYFKAFVKGASGEGASNVADFTTSGGGTPPVIEKTWHWNVTGNAAGLSMNVKNFRLNSKTYFLWGTDAGLNGATKTAEQNMEANEGGVGAHASLTGLKGATTYYYRAVVTNSNGTTQGPIQSFKTN